MESLGWKFREPRDALVDAFPDPQRLNDLLPADSAHMPSARGADVRHFPM